ncbi:MAG TPA: hypothetical protein VHN14_17280 [Kofleriaceae bacterium]|nr:hypothetical protein [Kofleriaceae bacterium]
MHVHVISSLLGLDVEDKSWIVGEQAQLALEQPSNEPRNIGRGTQTSLQHRHDLGFRNAHEDAIPDDRHEIQRRSPRGRGA